MNLPPEAATVRDTVAALLGNRDTPLPVHAATPRWRATRRCESDRILADGDPPPGGPPAAPLHAHRDRHVQPSAGPTAGPEAAVAAYWLEVADVLVLPTTSARADFNGALDYLEVGGLPPTVVAYIVPGPRRLRENPATLEYVRALHQRVVSLVEIPDDAAAVRLAGMEGVPVEQISSRLRLAYRELTEVIAALPRRTQA